MHIKILGKKWKLRFVPNLSGRNTKEKIHGYCDHPEEYNKEILITKGLDEKEELITIIHELLHAAFWWLDEEYVDKSSSDIGEVLIKLGYKKIKK